MVVIIPPGGADNLNNNPNQINLAQIPTSDLLDQVVGQPVVSDINASITDYLRNITITTTARVILEDHITLKIHDNKTQIALFNYSIPTFFAKKAVFTTFNSKFDNDLGLEGKIHEKPFKTFMGLNVTTYTVDIRENGTYANNTLDAVYIYARIETLNLITFIREGEVQKGNFTTPLRPTIPNIKVENSLIGIKLDAAQDQFRKHEMFIFEENGQEYPILRSYTLLEYRNQTRDAFDPHGDFNKNYDYTNVVFANVQPEEVTVDTVSTTTPFIFPSAERHVKIDPWGTVFVTETMTIKHLGASRPKNATRMNYNFQILGFTMQLDRFATVTDVRDSLGLLNAGEYNDNGLPRTSIQGGHIVLQVNFRNPIYGGDEYTFTVKYRMNATDIMAVDNGVYTMNTTMFSIFNTTVTNMRTTFEFPAGATVLGSDYIHRNTNSIINIDTNIDRDIFSYFKHVNLEYSFVNATYVDNTVFHINFKYNGFGHVQYILTFILIFITLLGLFVMAQRVEFKPSEKVKIEREKIPVDEIEIFIKKFREEFSANKAIINLQDQRRKKKITKKEYDAQVKTLEKRIRKNKIDLDKAIKELSSKGTRYDRLVTRIMIAYNKQKDINSNMSKTRASYARKQMKKELYQKMMREYNSDFEKQEAIIQKSLSELVDTMNQFK